MPPSRRTRLPAQDSRLEAQPSLAEQAFRRLEEMIVTMELAPGEVLSEAGLSSRIGIGRTPIREALKRLEVQRLVTSVPRKGLIVRDMNVAEHFALLEVLRPLDRLLAVKAARWATDSQRDALRSGAAEIRTAAGAGDRHGYLELDQRCDQIIAQAARNPFATDTLAPLYSHSRRFWCSFSQAPDLQTSAELHARLMEAVAEGDSEAAGKASDALLDFMEAFCRSVIGVV